MPPLDELTEIVPYDAPEKDLYEVGEIPPLGYVPKQMYAWAIRKERHGEPDTAMQVEVLPTWEIDSHEVLVLVMVRMHHIDKVKEKHQGFIKSMLSN